ncbi:MAG: carboxypeptidase regulatory-like domain-containing protein [Gammaproteobacteria bacterium]|nr:carboxypeptidase regulatory-like domain-containing protein [Gammaproteobacteria bacterium]
MRKVTLEGPIRICDCLAILALMLMTIPSLLAGEITGTVKWQGKVPEMKPISMAADEDCQKMDRDEIPRNESLVLGTDQHMANVFVRLKSGFAEKVYVPPREPVVLDQKGCVYIPHVLGLMVDQPLKIRNSDGMLHNVKTRSRKNRPFNLGMTKNKLETTRTFTKAEHMITFKCNVHSWMTAYIGVISHPFFDVTERDGKFSITGLDPGTYELEAWHERLGTQTRTVTIAGDESVQVDFTYTRPQKK